MVSRPRYFWSGVFDKKKTTFEWNQKELFVGGQGPLFQISAYSQVNELDGFSTIEDKALRSKGIMLSHREGSVDIYSDPFCSLPIFYVDTGTHIKVSSNPAELIDFSNTEFDPPGLLETLLFGAGMWDRTPFSGLRQLPAASRLNLNSATCDSYWDFNFEQSRDASLKEEDIIDLFDSRLQQIFNTQIPNKVVMGLSGGLDSRLCAHYLSKSSLKEIKLFTYAYDKRSDEYTFAVEAARHLGLNEPEFFKLLPKHYEAGLNYLPYWSAGQIGNDHSHICEYFRLNGDQLRKEGFIHLSSYYSDAILGWETTQTKGSMSLDRSEIWDALSDSDIDINVKEMISKDIETSLGRSKKTGHYSQIDEFRYLYERNPRFHMLLAFCQSQFINSIVPFADFDLLTYTMNLPLSLRGEKGIVDRILERKNPKLLKIRNSSSREYFYGQSSRLKNGNLMSRVRYIQFRCLNLINACLRFTGLTQYVILNRYQTENLEYVYKLRFEKFMGKIIKGYQVKQKFGLLYNILLKMIRPRLREKCINVKFTILSLIKISRLGNL